MLFIIYGCIYECNLIMKEYLQLALLLGEVHAFQEKKIDGIQTVELNSGKNEAKAGRKALNKKAEELVQNIQTLYQEIEKVIEMNLL